MTQLTSAFARFFKRWIPEPITLAALLTVAALGAAALAGDFPAASQSRWLSLFHYWYQGIWQPPLLVFMIQMLLILVLGHTLALAPPAQKMLDKLARLPQNVAQGAAIIVLLAMLASGVNWGLGLVFGAIAARKVAEALGQKGQAYNYPLLGAAAYAGFMVWHAGLSGSAPLKAAEPGHLTDLMAGMAGSEALPAFISLQHTTFSAANLISWAALLVVLPALVYQLAKSASATEGPGPKLPEKTSAPNTGREPAEKFDYSSWLGRGLAFIVLLTAALLVSTSGGRFLNLNFINFTFLGLGLWAHKNLHAFAQAAQKAAAGTAGILIQFPLYFGIMGLLKSSGLIALLSAGLLSLANENSLALFTFLSAGLVNFFVPSGGGQWAIQGPIALQSALELGVPLSKQILALAYGDQITNMMQPFWALPLLSITGLKARDILPYTLLLMIPGALIYLAVLLLL